MGSSRRASETLARSVTNVEVERGAAGGASLRASFLRVPMVT